MEVATLISRQRAHDNLDGRIHTSAGDHHTRSVYRTGYRRIMTERWERLAGETDKAYAAFMQYCRMGTGRSLRKLARKIKGLQDSDEGSTNYWRQLGKWSSEYNWPERASAFDAHYENLRQKRWERRQRTIRENDYTEAAELRKLARKILGESPKFVKATRKTTEYNPDGSPKTVVVTLALDAHLAINALNTASKLQRQAAGIDDTAKIRHEHTGKDGQPIETKQTLDLSSLTFEQLNELINRLEK